LGHLEALPLPTLNAGFEFSNPTFAGPHSTYRIAPEADASAPAPVAIPA
jgi:hypothetical protein